MEKAEENAGEEERLKGGLLNAGQIEELLRQLGCGGIRNIYTKVQASCPFAPWNHSSGRDSHPSFVVFVEDDGESGWHCSGCKASGRSMLGLVWKYGALSGQDVTRLVEFVHKNEKAIGLIDRVRRVSYEKKPKPVKKKDEPKPLDESEFDPFRNRISKYFVYQRHLTEDTIKAWGLGDDPRRMRAKIPIRDINGVLWGITGRLYAENCWCGVPFSDNMFDVLGKCPGCGRRKPPKYLHTKGLKKDRLFFGEHMIDRFIDVVYVVEGHLDAIWLWQLGYRNVVAVMGSTISDEQVEKLVEWFNLAIIVPDGDAAGREMIYGKERYRGAKAMLEGRINTLFRTLPDGMDPGVLSADDARTYIGEPTVLDNGSALRYKNQTQ